MESMIGMMMKQFGIDPKLFDILKKIQNVELEQDGKILIAMVEFASEKDREEAEEAIRSMIERITGKK